MSDEIQPSTEQGQGVQNITIEDEMSSSYIDYSMSVIVGRALPDARDGLKPVHRRVLYAMGEMGNVWNKPHKKCARIVGDVIGKYHPHGDQSVYDTLVRMAQPFSLRYPLIDGQGNFGSIDGDPPAAMRYTECRMDRLTDEMLDDIAKDTVDFRPNYDEKEEEPTVLPARLPNLLLNGSSGIAVGMATNIPPHNLTELVEGITHYIDNPDCTVDDLMRFVKGPDFPTGATICGTRAIEAMYKLGRGQMMVRGKAEVVEYKNKEAIIITEIPYMVNKASMIEKMAELVNEKVVEGISDIRDESKEDIRIVIELKRNAIGQVVLNNLYKHTQLQTTFGAIMLAIDHGRPKVMNLKELFRCYVDHRFEVITRRTRFELAKAEARKHILEGLLIALDHLDEVVAIIRASKNRDEAKARLIERFGFSDKQVDAILEMRLYQLTGLEREKVEAELRALLEQIAYLNSLLEDPGKIYDLIKQDLADIKAKFVTSAKRPDTRRTEIVPMEGEVNIKDLIADEPCVITLSQRGYVKRVPLTVYREQKRGGRGVTGAAIKEEDFIATVFVADTHDTLLLFTSQGRVFKKDVYEIPEAPRTSFGKPIVNLLELRAGETVVTLLPIRSFETGEDVFFATENGVIKRTALAEFRNVNRKGIIAIRFKDFSGDSDDDATEPTDTDTPNDADEQTVNDRLIQVRLVKETHHILLVTANGRAIRFPVSFKKTDADGKERETSVRRMGRASAGVRGIRLSDTDAVRSFDVVDDSATLLIATANGYGKRTVFAEFTPHHRGGGGMIAIKDDSGRNGKVVAAHAVQDDQSVIMITSTGMMVRSPVSDVRICGRAAQGVRLVRLSEGATLVSASTADAEEVPEGNGNGEVSSC